MQHQRKKITIAVVQNQPEFGHPEKNRESVARQVLGRPDPSANLIVLPELFATGY